MLRVNEECFFPVLRDCEKKEKWEEKKKVFATKTRQKTDFVTKREKFSSFLISFHLFFFSHSSLSYSNLLVSTFSSSPIPHSLSYSNLLVSTFLPLPFLIHYLTQTFHFSPSLLSGRKISFLHVHLPVLPFPSFMTWSDFERMRKENKE